MEETLRDRQDCDQDALENFEKEKETSIEDRKLLKLPFTFEFPAMILSLILRKLPPETKVVLCHSDPYRKTYFFVLKNKAFKPVPINQEIPDILATITHPNPECEKYEVDLVYPYTLEQG